MTNCPIKAHRCNEVKTGLREIFSSIQGEGIYVGQRQIFIRFSACHLRCGYCDTPQRHAPIYCELEPISGSGEKVRLENPISAQAVLDWVQHFIGITRHHSISLTGGEPLLYTTFLKSLLPQLAPLLPIYLETSGTQPEKLEEILEWIRIIAMDIKLPSATGEPLQFENHRRFYQLGCRKELFVKLVIAQETTTEELQTVVEIVDNRRIPIILQPVTSLTTGEVNVSASKMFELESFLSSHFADVRLIPQTHRMLSLL